ncbi:torsin-1A-interacting protein 2-like [Antedon mediterranea]|uniref:torsin-1A-interacting protein 2-like n=1 Tax=Antedon mediterranea TaxID=105859 RepID=UPI003AF6C4D4
MKKLEDFAIIIILVFMLFIFNHSKTCTFAGKDTSSEEVKFDLEDFRQNITRLRLKFPTQTPYLWRLIGSASIDFFKHDDPKRPSVILLAAGPDAHSTLDALASDLSTSYTSGDLVTKIDGSEYNMSDADIAKYEIDKTLDSGFNSGKKVAVIHHLESIPAKASMIFHSYCETDNAPFKKVVIIFTVHVTDELNPNDHPKTNEKKVEKHLIQTWKDSVDKDHINAMFSRVATAVAFVT